ncbi:hypothetical protein GALL_228970 [mine drainage metagenome]|uniref:DUF2141 domain-containing protein n=1 Tax=mine drainage metagenome TaxID=410659 RepID=A0A1J5RSN5_9ZZZZ
MRRAALMGLLLLAPLGLRPALAADLSVAVTGVRGTQGAVRVDLYNGPAGFRHEDQAFKVLAVPARPGTVQVTFKGLAPGRYAVIAYHDENGNGRLDRFMGMIPTEGWGLSNDPEVLGPPGFDPSAFTLPPAGLSLRIPLHY